MSVGMTSSKEEPANLNEISMMADIINHAVPNPDELQSSIRWLIEKNFVTNKNEKYHLTESGLIEFDKSMKKSGRFARWDYLENVVKNYAQHRI